MSNYRIGLMVPVRGPALQKQHYVVGSLTFPTVGDRKDVVDMLTTEFAQLQNDMATALGWTMDHPVYDETDHRYAWYHSSAVPTLNEWQRWRDDQQSWWTRFATSWDTYKTWENRLLALRQSAKDNGFDLKSPEPTAIPQTWWDEMKKGLGDLWSLIKIVAISGLIIGGVYYLSQVGFFGRGR